ncbi:hypothetical protein TG4357_00516 [Thalassovita gelatinovora]|uniref:EF-hand domain-containing protein n=1 Tax=Thalassovita gelatinovora TaxID=53501 RepID=A0A0P1F5N9_THAGE|nr:hypothetical protein [Thalassovita gelatinovora]QIZ80789.1 hypothetical protein HFZ77_10050 [Thalassovita gelatinovora]CUH63171.1 hypothetical protein TG4357_00516 [Thalassovita gelatinovora]SEQ62923.1 EF hand [Thalassovita gelatinovora]
MNVMSSISASVMSWSSHSQETQESTRGEKLVARLDQDQDGGISAEELKDTRLGRRMSVDTFSKIDDDNDGKLTADEIDSFRADNDLSDRRTGSARRGHHHRPPPPPSDTADTVSQLADLQSGSSSETETSFTIVSFESTTTKSSGETTTTNFLAIQAYSRTSSSAGTDTSSDATVDAEAIDVTPGTMADAGAGAETAVVTETADNSAMTASAETSDAVILAQTINATNEPDSAAEILDEVAAAEAAEAAAATEEVATADETAKIVTSSINMTALFAYSKTVEMATSA